MWPWGRRLSKPITIFRTKTLPQAAQTFSPKASQRNRCPSDCVMHSRDRSLVYSVTSTKVLRATDRRAAQSIRMQHDSQMHEACDKPHCSSLTVKCPIA